MMIFQRGRESFLFPKQHINVHFSKLWITVSRTLVAVGNETVLHASKHAHVLLLRCQYECRCAVRMMDGALSWFAEMMGQ